MPLQRRVLRVRRAERVLDIGAQHARLLIRAVALVVHLVEEDARSPRRMRVEPWQHGGHVVRPVLALHSEAGRARDLSGQLAIGARAVRVDAGDLPDAGKQRGDRGERERPGAAHPGLDGELGAAHEKIRRFWREQRNERQPMLDPAENRRRADHERKDRCGREAQLQQPQRRNSSLREVPRELHQRRGEQRDLRQRQRQREQDQWVEDGEGRSPQLAAEVVPGVVDVMGVEGNPIGQVTQRIVPEQRPRDDQHERAKEQPGQLGDGAPAHVAGQQQRVDQEHRRQQPRVVLHGESAAEQKPEPRAAPRPPFFRCGIDDSDRSRPGDAHPDRQRADRHVEAGEVAVEERPLGAPEQRRREHGGCAGPLRAEHREPVRQQGREEEGGKTPGERVRKPVQPRREDQMRCGERQFRQAGVLEVDAKVPLRLAQCGDRRANRKLEPLLVARSSLEVVALVPHEPDGCLACEERDERRCRERDREPPAHGAVVHAETQNGRSVSGALTRSANACSPAAIATSRRRHPDCGGTVAGTTSSLSGLPSSSTATRTGPRSRWYARSPITPARTCRTPPLPRASSRAGAVTGPIRTCVHWRAT